MANYCVDCGTEISPESTRCCSCAAKARWSNPENRREAAEKTRRAWERGDFDGRDPTQYSEKLSKAIKAAWRRGAYGKEWKRNLAESRRKWDNEEYRSKVARGVERAWARGDYDGVRQSMQWRKQISGKLKERWQDDEYRQYMARALREAHARGCFKGSAQSPTLPERLVMTVLEFLGIGYEFNEFMLESYTYDFYLPALGVLIEYDGWFWHQYSDQQKRDAIKDRLAQEAGYRLIRLKGRQDSDLTGPEIWSILIRELRYRKGCDL